MNVEVLGLRSKRCLSFDRAGATEGRSVTGKEKPSLKSGLSLDRVGPTRDSKRGVQSGDENTLIIYSSGRRRKRPTRLAG